MSYYFTQKLEKIVKRLVHAIIFSKIGQKVKGLVHPYFPLDNWIKVNGLVLASLFSKIEKKVKVLVHPYFLLENWIKVKGLVHAFFLKNWKKYKEVGPCYFFLKY